MLFRSELQLSASYHETDGKTVIADPATETSYHLVLYSNNQKKNYQEETNGNVRR
jgi:hypothetical protein